MSLLSLFRWIGMQLSDYAFMQSGCFWFCFGAPTKIRATHVDKEHLTSKSGNGGHSKPQLKCAAKRNRGHQSKHWGRMSCKAEESPNVTRNEPNQRQWQIPCFKAVILLFLPTVMVTRNRKIVVFACLCACSLTQRNQA